MGDFQLSPTVSLYASYNVRVWMDGQIKKKKKSKVFE